ncbi:MAG: FHA domain-containing protein [Anaerolineae bacterium]
MDNESGSEPDRTVMDHTPTATLVAQKGPSAGQRFPLHGEVNLGRDRSNVMVFLDKKVSRHHAKLIPIDETYIITDLGSSNGTFVNGIRIGQPVRLYTGDAIRIGDTELKFFAGDVPDPATGPAQARSTPPTPLVDLSPNAPILERPWLNQAERPLWIVIGCGGGVLIGLTILIALVMGYLLGQNLL